MVKNYISFPVTVTKTPRQKQVRKKGVYFSSQFNGAVHHGVEVMAVRT